MSQRLHAAVAGFALFSLQPDAPGGCQIIGLSDYWMLSDYRMKSDYQMKSDNRMFSSNITKVCFDPISDLPGPPGCSKLKFKFIDLMP